MMAAPADAAHVAEQLPSVLAARDRAAFERLLAPDVRWGGREDTDQTCHDRGQAGDFYDALLAGGVRLDVVDCSLVEGKVLVRLEVAEADNEPYLTQVLLTVEAGLVTDILELEDAAHSTP